MRTSTKNIFLALLVFGGSFGCSVKKYIPEDEQLYTGAEIQLDSESKIQDLDEISSELNELLGPEPNSKILGVRFGLWAHYKAQKEKPGFINRFLNDKFGEEPIYFSDVSVGRTEELILNRLENRGFFYSSVSSEVDLGDKFASMSYQAQVTQPYTLQKYQLAEDSLQIYSQISSLLEETELDSASRFDLNSLKEERTRIDQQLKDRGYYNFNSEYLIFEADTNVSDSTRKFNLYLRLKRDVPEKSLIPYEISRINVFPNYSINESEEKLDTVVVEGKNFIQGNFIFKPELLNDYILIEKGQTYDPKLSRLSTNRLSSIGNYKFVNLRYDELNTSDSVAHLEANFFLSPLTKRSVRAEVLGISKSNNFAGPALNLTYRNRNLFKGGETLNLSTRFGYEFQVGGGERSNLKSFEYGIKADLIFPRVIFFVPIREKLSYSVPKTKMGLGFEYLSRGGLYRLNTFSANYGYFWNANKWVYHELNPISINLVNQTQTSPEFEEILEQNPFLRRSFEQNFIVGINYLFNYNKLIDKDRRHGVFVGTGLDIAGNLLNGLSNLSGSESGKFLGLEYAQYAKIEQDLRYYFRPAKEHVIATRLWAGLGVPIGNSLSLPYVKQFFSGGPNSVRAFRIRSIGPGSYQVDESSTNSFFDQSGDIRLEGNIEYRFPIFSFLKGALFMDAGNIWLWNENEALPGGKFSKDWFKELAVGTGIGLRVDVQFFVIRFDLATPLRYPYLPEGDRWGNTWDVGSKTWRRNNLNFNFAIGYPF
ncbi:translocation and assembly module lipoprotein TamL [Algoriphagus namhaensis]